MNFINDYMMSTYIWQTALSQKAVSKHALLIFAAAFINDAPIPEIKMIVRITGRDKQPTPQCTWQLGLLRALNDNHMHSSSFGGAIWFVPAVAISKLNEDRYRPGCLKPSGSPRTNAPVQSRDTFKTHDVTDLLMIVLSLFQ